MKLTPKQNCVIYLLQQGWVLITDQSMTGAIVGNENWEFRINGGLFWRLVNMDLIYQDLSWPFDYKLTTLGKKIKTKPVEL